MRRNWTWTAVLLALLAAVVAGTVWYLGRPKVEDLYPVTSRDAVLPHATQVLDSADMWANQRLVKTPGADGVRRTFVYFHERFVNGKLTLREQIAPPDGKPRSTVISKPTTEVVVVGTRKGASYAVNAKLPFGQPIGVIGRSGTMWIEATGTVRFAGTGANATVFGNTTYAYYYIPIRRDIPPGALLLKVEGGGWMSLSELKALKGSYELTGRPGQKVTAVVNDSTSYFGDNDGAFQLLVWPDGQAPK